MAIKFLNGVDLNQNQLIAARVENLGVAPATPVEGQIYYDSTPGDQILYFWNGTSWVSSFHGRGQAQAICNEVRSARSSGKLRAISEGHCHGREQAR